MIRKNRTPANLLVEAKSVESVDWIISVRLCVVVKFGFRLCDTQHPGR